MANAKLETSQTVLANVANELSSAYLEKKAVYAKNAGRGFTFFDEVRDQDNFIARFDKWNKTQMKLAKNVCRKCFGTGHIEAYNYHEGGICFQCEGTGLPSRKAQKVAAGTF